MSRQFRAQNLAQQSPRGGFIVNVLLLNEVLPYLNKQRVEYRLVSAHKPVMLVCWHLGCVLSAGRKEAFEKIVQVLHCCVAVWIFLLGGSVCKLVLPQFFGPQSEPFDHAMCYRSCSEPLLCGSQCVPIVQQMRAGLWAQGQQDALPLIRVLDR